MQNAPHKYTNSSNLRSPGKILLNRKNSNGLCQVIEWISEIWREYDRNIIIDSFACCGITNDDPTQYHPHLRHFVREGEILNNYIAEDDGTGDLNGFGEFEGQDEETAYVNDTDESDSESDDDDDGDDDNDDDDADDNDNRRHEQWRLMNEDDFYN